MEKFRQYLKEQAADQQQIHARLKENEAKAESDTSRTMYNSLAAHAWDMKCQYETTLAFYDQMLAADQIDASIHQMD